MAQKSSFCVPPATIRGAWVSVKKGSYFGSTANGCPSVQMPIPNRYYERVLGWRANLTLERISDSYQFHPITERVRQVDHHGGYTAAAGHALYTARQYPASFWNRVAFVNGPTGHLTGAFVISQKGTEYRSRNLFNLIASDDEWTAPIMAEVGPDGQVWVIDWYNYIVQHNPTPAGFKQGKGAAYETDLRDKKFGRVYRVVADGTDGSDYPDLSQANPQQLVDALAHPTMLVRKHAQRLLVESGDTGIVARLLEMLADESVDSVGLNVGAIHALWTLHGLGQISPTNTTVLQAVTETLDHPSAGVRRNAILVLPANEQTLVEILSRRMHRDRNFNVRLVAMLAIADSPADSQEAARGLIQVASNPTDVADRWIRDALTCAAAQHSGTFLSQLSNLDPVSEPTLSLIKIVAEHHARSQRGKNAAVILAGHGNG
jgi:hypothetical protein